MDWIDLAENRDQCRALEDTLTNFRVPQNVGKFLTACQDELNSAELVNWSSRISETEYHPSRFQKQPLDPIFLTLSVSLSSD